MPRPCAVEAHARGYKTRLGRVFVDATALRRGDSRSQLQNPFRKSFCDGLALWQAHARGYKTRLGRVFVDATALRRGDSRSRLLKSR